MKKVNMDVMQRWITQRITSLLGFEDDIVVGTCVNYLSEEVRPKMSSRRFVDRLGKRRRTTRGRCADLIYFVIVLCRQRYGLCGDGTWSLCY